MITTALLWTAVLTPTAEAGRTVYDPTQPVALGSRMGAWVGPYQAPMLGGHLKLRPTKALGLEGFSDHTLAIQDATARHDHILGFSVFTPALLGGDRWYIGPTLGSCVDFRVTSPLVDRMPGNTDVLFGVHGGAISEIALGDDWSVQTSATAFSYFGNAASSDEWTAASSNALHTSVVGQVVAGLSYSL